MGDLPKTAPNNQNTLTFNDAMIRASGEGSAISTIEEKVTQIASDIATVKTNSATAATKTTAIATDTTAMKADVATIKTDIGEIETLTEAMHDVVTEE